MAKYGLIDYLYDDILVDDLPSLLFFRDGDYVEVCDCKNRFIGRYSYSYFQKCYKFVHKSTYIF